MNSSEIREHWVNRLGGLGPGVAEDRVSEWVESLEDARVGPCCSKVFQACGAKEKPDKYLAAALRDGWIDDLVEDVQSEDSFGVAFSEGLAMAEELDGGPMWQLSEDRKDRRMQAYASYRERLPRVVLGSKGSQYEWQTEAGNTFTAVVWRGKWDPERSPFKVPQWETFEGTLVDSGCPLYHFPEYPTLWLDAVKAMPKETLVVAEMTL